MLPPVSTNVCSFGESIVFAVLLLLCAPLSRDCTVAHPTHHISHIKNTDRHE